MRGRLITRIEDRHRWDRLSVSFWFIPLVMAMVAVLLTWAIYWVDGLIPNEVLESSRFIVAGSVDEVRGFLFTMATTCLATAGVVFTLLTLPLSTVAAQYRLPPAADLSRRPGHPVRPGHVRRHVRLLHLRRPCHSPGRDPARTPQLLVTVGFLLFLGTFASLILLIQHIATMLQAPNIAAAAGSELMDVIGSDIQEVFGAGTRQQVEGESSDPPIRTAGHPVRATGAGYIQYIDPRRTLALARERDLVIRLLLKPGRFAVSGAVLATVWPADRIDARSEREIRNAFHLGRQRTPTQDVEYAVNQLAEMGVRAMSPAINDPFTAMTCLDYMGDGLALFVRQRKDSPTIYDREGRLRIVFDPVTFDQLLDAAFDMLRHASCNNAKVLLHMLDVVDAIGRETDSPEARRVLARHVALIEAESLAGNLIDEDLRAISERSEALKAELGGSPR